MTVEKLIVILRESLGSPGPLNWVLIINDLTALVQAQAQRDAKIVAGILAGRGYRTVNDAWIALEEAEAAILKSACLDG